MDEKSSAVVILNKIYFQQNLASRKCNTWNLHNNRLSIQFAMSFPNNISRIHHPFYSTKSAISMCRYLFKYYMFASDPSNYMPASKLILVN